MRWRRSGAIDIWDFSMRQDPISGLRGGTKRQALVLVETIAGYIGSCKTERKSRTYCALIVIFAQDHAYGLNNVASTQAFCGSGALPMPVYSLLG